MINRAKTKEKTKITKINFKKELEAASRSMIMVHEPKLLIKLIIRMIVRKLGVMHAGMVIYEPDRNDYVLGISRGEPGLKIPQGFTRFDNNSPIITLFSTKEYRYLTLNRNAIVSSDINRLIWREGVIEEGADKSVTKLLHEVDEQMQLLNVNICVPAYYRHKLLAILLLGNKKDGSKYKQDELDFFAALASDTAMAIRNAQLFKGLKEEAKRNKELFLSTIQVLGSTIEAKDAYTRGHTERVTKYAVAIARQLHENGSYEFSDEFFENLYISGTLHDIGKIGVPEAILNKKGRLSVEEYEIMKTHTTVGAEIVQPLKLPREIVDGIKYHHETYIGTGYPEGIKGEKIPITAAIIAVADCFDAMTTNRPYRKGLSNEEAIKEIKNNSGTQFHPPTVKAFLEISDKSLN